jgi:hypothetical protein
LPANETIGTTVFAFGAVFGIHTELLRLVRLMQERETWTSSYGLRPALCHNISGFHAGF